MNGHTKGPWIHDGDGWITAESGESVVDYAGCGSHEADWRNPSDLQLALAAPDLLEALESANIQMRIAYECVEAGRYDEALLHLGSMPRQRIDAIAKARGEK